MFDIVIKNGYVVDGTGSPWFKADIGIDDGLISPVLVPGAYEDACPSPLPAPKLDNMKAYGFKLVYKIIPVYLEDSKALKIAYVGKKGKVIEPIKHYPLLIEYINKEAINKYNCDIGTK